MPYFGNDENSKRWSNRVSGPNLMSDVKQAISALFNRSSTTGGLGLLQVCLITTFRMDGWMLKQ